MLLFYCKTLLLLLVTFHSNSSYFTHGVSIIIFFCVLLVIHLYRERAISLKFLNLCPMPIALFCNKNMFNSNQSLCGALLSSELIRSWARDFPSMDTELTSTFLHSTPVQHLLSSSVKCYGYWSIITILILWILLILNDIGKVLSWWVHGARRLQLLQKKH